MAQAIGVVSLVGDEALDGADCRDQRRRKRDVVGIARREQKDMRAALNVGQGVDFRRSPAARAADGLAKGPPFPPAAERWALMCVLSIATVPMRPVEPVKASNISNQMPCRLQRLKRL